MLHISCEYFTSLFFGGRQCILFPYYYLLCDDPEQPPKAPGVTTHDYDGDGYTEIDGDCNDEDATVSPGSTEECDDIDNDCDGEIDNGVLTTYYADTDGDSYGQESTLIEVCTGTNLAIISKMQETVMIQMLL